DRGSKFEHYRKLQSLREYILVAQDRLLVERYVRQEDNSWVLTVFDEPDTSFSFGTIDAEIPLAEIYAGVTFGNLSDPRRDANPA
ncbi:MAG TPA: hypothetical protein VGH74_14180, partial [Planctomycetaceae bacterium]